jgi:hypothetical protein
MQKTLIDVTKETMETADFADLRKLPSDFDLRLRRGATALRTAFICVLFTQEYQAI